MSRKLCKGASSRGRGRRVRVMLVVVVGVGLRVLVEGLMWGWFCREEGEGVMRM